MKIEYLQGIAIFMAMIVIMIPVYSASVFAGLGSVEAKGSSGIDGFVEKDDSIDFEVHVSIEGNESIAPEQVKLGTDYSFDSCTAGMNDFVCTYKYPATDTIEFVQKSTPYTINLYDDSSGLVDSYTGSVTVDKNKPSLSFTASPSLANSGEITLSYTITDPETADSACVGIGRVNIYGGTTDVTETIDTASCSYAGEYKVAVETLEDGSYTYYAQVFDRFGQESDVKSASFTIDKVGVVVDTGSLKIVDSQGNDITHVGTKAIPATVSFNIAGDDLDKNLIRGDLSELNHVTNYKNLAASCGVTANGVTRCSWSISILLNSGGTKNIYVSASDTAGNEETATLTKSFVYDNVGPVVTSLESSYYFDGSYFVAPKNNFGAILSETTGLNAKDIYLDLTGIGAGTKAADSCKGSGDTYICYWNNIAASGSGETKVAITQASKDVLGNYINESYSIDVTIDTKKPELIFINVTPIGGIIPAYEDYIKTGDSLYIVTKLREDYHLGAAKGDFSAILTSDAKNVEGVCNEEEDYWVCEWITSPIDKTGYISGNLKFNFTDRIGNSLIYKYPITVYELEKGAVDYWSHTLSCSPRLVDRRITPLVNQRVYCHIDLDSQEDAETKAFIFNKQLCVGEADSLGYVSDVELFNDEAGSEDLYLKVTLAKGEMKIDNISLSCPVYIYSKVGNKLTGVPEEENLSIGIEFYNLPLGEYGSDIEEKIEDSKEFAWYVGDWVGTVNKWLNYGTKICSLLSTLDQLALLINKVALFLRTTAMVLRGVPLAQVEAKILDETGQATQQTAGATQQTAKFVWGNLAGNKFCKFMSCRLFYDEVWGEPGPGGGSIADGISEWQRTVLDKANLVATAGWGEIGGRSAYSYSERGIGGMLNPKDSIVISTLTLCLPGVIYNLNKLRQIQCMYVDCLQNYATEGLPLKACEDAKHYAECKYVWGEIFQLAPLAWVFNSFSNLIKQALSSPWWYVDVAMGFVCQGVIKVPWAGKAAYVCLVNDIFGLMADVWQDLEGIGEGWEVTGDYCDRIDEEEEEEEEEED